MAVATSGQAFVSLLSWSAVVIAVGSAHAADLPGPAPLKPAAYVSSWTGCYVGGQIGGARSHSHWDYTNNNPYDATGNEGPQLISGADFSQRRGVIGGQVGCNSQLSGPWVVGLEASWMSNPLNQTVDNHNLISNGRTIFREEVATNVRSIASVTGRLGFAVAPDWLVYGKGGFATGQIATSGTITPAGTGFDWIDTKWHYGWTVGGGVEYRLFRNVTVGAEYNYYKLGNRDHAGIVAVTDTLSTGQVVPANPVAHRVNADVQTVMARINFYGLGPAAANTGQSPWFTGTFSSFAGTEANYASWTGTRGSNVFAGDPGKGYQVYSPTTIGINYDLPSELKIETRFKSGYVYARHETSGQGATYNGPVDSQVSVNATFLNFDSVRPLLGVAMNLPTGNSYLPFNQRFARMDPDLVPVGSYGAGFNVNPTGGVVIGLNQSTAMSVSAGYAWQGVYTKEGVDLSTANGLGTFNLQRRINPGDAFTANGNFTTSFGTSAVLLASFAYMTESRVTIDGVPSGRAGAKYVSNASFTYQFDPRWALGLNGSWSFSEKNDIPGLAGDLVTEPKNSNSHVVIGSVDPSYLVNDRLRLGVNYSILWRDHNFYDPIESQFIPAKLKNLVGGSATYVLTPTATVTVRGSHAWIKQDTGPLLQTTIIPPAFANLPPSLSYHVWAASVAAVARF